MADTMPTAVPHPIAYTIKEAAAAVRISERAIYDEIREGRLPARKYGRRTIIMHADLTSWGFNLPSAKT